MSVLTDTNLLASSNHKCCIKNAKDLTNIFIKSLRLDNPKWHPDWKRGLGYKLARILFLAGAKEIKHGVSKNHAFNIHAKQPPLHKQTIYIYPYIDSSIESLGVEDKIDKKRPLIHTIFRRFGIGYSGCSYNTHTQISSIKEMELYSDIVLHFAFFTDHFVIEK